MPDDDNQLLDAVGLVKGQQLQTIEEKRQTSLRHNALAPGSIDSPGTRSIS